MNEPIRRPLVADELTARIAEDIAAFVAGEGPDLEAEHLALGAEPGALQALWADARQERKAAVVGPNQSSSRISVNTWAVSENSKECLIGKRVGVFADVRFKPGRQYGASYDPGGIGHVSSELFLNIIGEDTVTIGRKYKSPWHGQLRLKLMLISNDVPNLNDCGGVLPSRFVKVRFGVSFYGHEDVNLRGKLEGELSGIAARCVAAYQRLRKRGWFIQPQSADVLDREVLGASDPFIAMALECFEPDPEGEVTKTTAHTVYKAWRENSGRFDLEKIASNRFGNRLRAVPGFEHITDAPRDHGQPRAWLGLRLKRKGKDA
jgi:putative DNA primase/helicase